MTMRFARCVLLVALIGCGGAEPEVVPEEVIATPPDTAAMTTLRDSAQVTLASLLRNPGSATFDSVRVMQPPGVDDRLPAWAVCGQISGRPGIGGRSTPTRFVYQSRWTVFVEEANNQAAFADLWSRNCEAPATALLDAQ